MMRSLSNRLLNPSRSKQVFILSASIAYLLLFASQSSSSAQSPRATGPVVHIVTWSRQTGQ